MRLLTAAANGNGATTEIKQWGNRELVRLFTLFVFGTFGGATVTLQISPNGTDWFTVSGVSITSASAINVEFRAPYVRAVVSGGTGEAVDAILL